MKMKLKSEVHDYARALRAIGQDLAKLVPHSLELEVVDNDFIVRGQGNAAQSHQRRTPTRVSGKGSRTRSGTGSRNHRRRCSSRSNAKTLPKM